MPSDGRDEGLMIIAHEIIVWSNDQRRYRKGKFLHKDDIKHSLVEQLKIGAEECRCIRNHVVKGVLARTRYTIEIRSRNNAGWSSLYIEQFTTPSSDGPPPPQNVTFVSQTPTTITYSWSACLGVAGLEIKKFEMQLLTNDSISVVKRERIDVMDSEIMEKRNVQDPEATRYYIGTIHNLPPNQRLIFCVKARNENHWSNPSVGKSLLSKAPRFPSYGLSK